MTAKSINTTIVMGVLGLLLMAAAPVLAHCDTFEGPVIQEARVALEKGNVTPLLKWVPKTDEGEIQKAFQTTLRVRALSPEARAMADRYFFETLVRIHRIGEGESYTGLQSGDAIPSVVVKADESLAKGDVDDLAKRIAAHVEKAVRERFAEAAEAKKHKDDTVEAGRDYVEAYVQFVHLAEHIHTMLSNNASAAGHGH